MESHSTTSPSPQKGEEGDGSEEQEPNMALHTSQEKGTIKETAQSQNTSNNKQDQEQEDGQSTKEETENTNTNTSNEQKKAAAPTTTTTTMAPTTTTTTAPEAPTTTTTRAPSRLREIDGSLSSSAWVCAPLLLAVSALAYTTLG
ncbi:mucin TcMUCII [Trypanosoma cruzi]|nr:mucin TcMUCII [Trypanosoma cruzi]